MTPLASVLGPRLLAPLMMLVLVGCAAAPTGPEQVGSVGDGAGFPAQVFSARPVAGPAIAVQYTIGGCDGVKEAQATPQGDQVKVVLRLASTGGTCADIGAIKEIVLPLDEPLGDRVVVNEAGDQIPRA